MLVPRKRALIRSKMSAMMLSTSSFAESSLLPQATQTTALSKPSHSWACATVPTPNPSVPDELDGVDPTSMSKAEKSPWIRVRSCGTDWAKYGESMGSEAT